MSEGLTYRLQDSYPILDHDQPLAELFRHKASVLVVEDEEDLNHALAFRLRREGFHVLSSFDGPTGWHETDFHRPDIVLLDLVLPGRDGFRFLNELQRSGDLGLVPVIAMTSHAGPDVREEARRLGVRDVFEKPVDPVRLIARVREVLEERGRASGRRRA